jgi:hypothetical protein
MTDQNTDTNTEVKIEAPVPEVSEMFSPEEVKQRQDELTSLWTDRRSKLSEDDRKKEDETFLTEKQKKEQAKAEAEKANVIPEKYEFKLPEGMEMDTTLLSEVEPIFKEIGLTQDKAQKVIDAYVAKVLPSYVKQQTATWEAQKASWVESVKADKEIGGDKFAKAVEDANRVLNTLGTPELKKAFNDYGLGNHPEFVRVFSRMAANMKEDGIIQPDATVNKKPTSLTEMANAFYK